MVDEWEGSDAPHKQIAEHLRVRIEEGDFFDTLKLPARRELAEEYQVPPGTIARATTLLQEAGFVKYEPGHGLMVVW